MKNRFRAARQILDEQRLAESRHGAEACDWSRPEDVRLHRAQQRQAARKRVLDAMVGVGRRCVCGRFKPFNNQWVIGRRKGKRVALCRSCWVKPVTEREVIVSDDSLFGGVETRVVVDARKLVEARDAVGLSRREFAGRCGWSSQYQLKLETGLIKSVGIKTAQKLLSIFREAGYETAEKLPDL